GAIEERSMALAGRAKDLLVETPGVTLLSPTARAGSSGLVSFAVEGVEPQVIVDRLWDEDSVVLRTVRNPDGVRFSFAWFNTEDEVDRVLEAIRKIGTG
ncbi:MAG: aminotransferase class V-fold PLP-dependent enzyme, partial [Dehalococcoidia bacterium]|nr:aminotransferase class V-fold PLP-dependent enzyme [Dehalococcoidia bacterium]